MKLDQACTYLAISGGTRRLILSFRRPLQRRKPLCPRPSLPLTDGHEHASILLPAQVLSFFFLMRRSHKKGSGEGTNPKNKRRNDPIEWTPKMTMNVLDLSRDDDFLNHLLVEKLGTGIVPLYVHKMDPKRPLPKTDPKDLLAIVQRVSNAAFTNSRVIDTLF